MSEKKKKIKTEDGDTYDWIRATVRNDGVHLEYKGTDLDRQGRDMIDDDGAKDWPDNDTREMVGRTLALDLSKENLELIQLEYEVLPDED